MTKNNDVLVITGAGGIGQAIARRQGAGKHILFADISEDNQTAAAAALKDLGHRVSTQRVGVSSRESVHALARRPARHRAGARRLRPRDRPGGRGDRHRLDGRSHVPAVRFRAGARARPRADRRAACPAVPEPRGHGRRRLRLRQARQPPAGRGRKPRATGHVGTPDEVAAAAAFLLGPEAGFITGSDLLMDGGVIAALRAGRWSLAA